MADPKILQTFANPAPGSDYVIEHTHHEFTSLCPITGHPDFATITVRYVADRSCVELKSLKLYFHAYRNEGIYFEAVTNRICDDSARGCRPRRLTVVSRLEGPRRHHLGRSPPNGSRDGSGKARDVTAAGRPPGRGGAHGRDSPAAAANRAAAER